MIQLNYLAWEQIKQMKVKKAEKSQLDTCDKWEICVYTTR